MCIRDRLVVGASSTPHAEILEKAQEYLTEKGIDLEIVIFDDYVQPNLQLDAGDLDANYFQHLPYLENFNEENGTKLISCLLYTSQHVRGAAGRDNAGKLPVYAAEGHLVCDRVLRNVVKLRALRFGSAGMDEREQERRTGKEGNMAMSRIAGAARRVVNLSLIHI